jgi:hypothetical protein
MTATDEGAAFSPDGGGCCPVDPEPEPPESLDEPPLQALVSTPQRSRVTKVRELFIWRHFLRTD